MSRRVGCGSPCDRLRVEQVSWAARARSFCLTIFVLAAAAPVLIALSYLMLLNSARVLSVAAPLETGDAIVVLGGNGPVRADKAVALYRDRRAAKVLVTGSGDCLGIRDRMIALGIPNSAIWVECFSLSTWENAEYSAPILQRLNVRQALLVTDSFHMRRALGCFKSAAPFIRFFPAPVDYDGPLLELAGRTGGNAVVKEYFKIAWYWIRYGVSPLGVDADGGWS